MAPGFFYGEEFMLYFCVIKFTDGVELGANAVTWNDVELFISKWMDRPWHRICISQREM
jgi:hypothetical protein